MDAGFILPQEKQQIFNEIDGWLKTVYPYKNSSASLCDPIDDIESNFRIMAQRKKYDIYLRFGKTWISEKEKSIVIARIGFNQKRAGHGSNLLKLLEKISNYIITNQSASNVSMITAGHLHFTLGLPSIPMIETILSQLRNCLSFLTP